MHRRSEPRSVCRCFSQVGRVEHLDVRGQRQHVRVHYHLRCIDDLHQMLRDAGDWVPLGNADEQKLAAEGTVEAWGCEEGNPAGPLSGARSAGTNSTRGRGPGDTCPMAVSEPLQTVVTLDVEGVLIPEIWVATAERTGVDELRRTTRDEPDYDVLMRGRLELLREHGLGMADLTEAIASLAPLDGAREFLDELRSRTQVILLSDTFEEFARPFMAQLGWPTVLCHRLVVDPDGHVSDYRLRQPDQKRRAVQALHALNYRVLAAGDSYNDTTMLAEADHGFLFRAPANVIAEFPEFPAVTEYDDLISRFAALL